MTLEHRPPHLTTHSLVEAILGTDRDTLAQWSRHLSDNCPECWKTIRTGVHVPPLQAYEETRLRCTPENPPEPVGLALNRLAAFHASETQQFSKDTVCQSLLPRHRHALQAAHRQRYGFARLVLEECQIPLSRTIMGEAIMTPIELAEKSIGLLTLWDNDDTRSLLRDTEAWCQVALARAAHLQGASGKRIRQIVHKALSLARQGTGDCLLAATLWEMRSLPADVESQEKIAHLDRAIELVPDAAWKDLRAEFLVAKAMHQVWHPEQAAETSREALALLDARSPLCLRTRVLDQLATAELELGNREEAQTLWLEAQRLATTVDEDPVTTCERWVQLAQAASYSFVDTAGFFQAAIAGYTTLQLTLEERQLILEFASVLINHGQAEHFAKLEPELVKLIPAAVSEVQTILHAAEEKGIPAVQLHQAAGSPGHH